MKRAAIKLVRLHAWPRTPRAAVALQIKLARRVRLIPFEGLARVLAGVDATISRDGRSIIAGVVLWDADSNTILESHVARRRAAFPYVPGLLTFRELPAVLAALRKLRCRPDAVLCDAQGIAHPRRCGLATHLGLWLKIPTIGCAKSRLCGTHAEPAAQRGARELLMDRNEVVGEVVRTRTGVRPIFVSPGNLCDRASAVRMALAACCGYRLPEPTRRAHQFVTAARLASPAQA